MKYLNKHFSELVAGKNITYRGKVYWANVWTGEVFAHSVDEEILGSISGYKVANIVKKNGVYEVVKEVVKA